MDDGLFTAEWLQVANHHGYGTLPIPQPLDLQITELLRRFRAMSATERVRELERVRSHDLFVYLAYSERMASLAVRRHDSEPVVLGLIADGLDDWRNDFRDNLLVVSLHYDASVRCGWRPDDLFNDAAVFLPERSAAGLRSFLVRSERDKSLAAMGYVADTDADGFRYRWTG